MLTNITLEEALVILLKENVRTEAVHVPLLDSLGSVLAEDVISDINMPPFDKSPLDGYALRSEDIEEASKEHPVLLDIIDFVPAGYVTDKIVSKNQAVKIMTGAKIPEGADVIIRFEETEEVGEKVKIFNSYPSGSNISKSGEDMKIGDLVLKKGIVIDAPEIGILSTLGKSYVKVYRKPRIALLSTGDELVDIQQPMAEGKIRNSNAYTIAAQIKKAGGKPLMLGICRDGLDSIVEKLSGALGWADMVITTGGVSVGDCDLVKEAFQKVGGEILFWRVRMKPGTPIAVAKINNKFMFGLSGNPAAAYITFEQFVKPVILQKMGKQKYKAMTVQSILESEFNKVSHQNRFVRGVTVYKNGQYYTSLPTKHSSGVLSSLSGTNSLFYVPAGTGPYQHGQLVTVQLLDYPEV